MKSLKRVARCGALMSVAASSALILAACSAGQVTQTSSQVAAVDGASAESADKTVVVRDVTVHITQEGEAGIKFTAVNQDPNDTQVELQSITVAGETVSITGTSTIDSGCSLVGDIASELELLSQPDSNCLTYVKTSFTNPGFAYSSNQDVVFTFDNTELITRATVSMPVPMSGTQDRETGATEHSH